jgi:hypothetical protein
VVKSWTLALLVFLVPPSWASSPVDAYALAAVDVQRVPALARPFVRYLWVRGRRVEDFKAAVLACNYVLRSPLVYRPDAIGTNGTRLIRVDLRRLALDPTNVKEVAELIALWEEFQFDPFFSLLITRDTLRLLTEEQLAGLPKPRKRVPAGRIKVKTGTREKLVEVPEYVGKDGKTYNGKWVKEDVFEEIDSPFAVFQEVEIKDVKDIDVLRVPSPALDPKLVEALVLATGSQAPVVDSEYFIDRALTTLKYDGPYAVVFGGLYYELTGIPANVKGKTDEDAFYEFIGLKDPGQSLEDLFRRLGSDRRAAMFASGVTNGPRTVEFYRNRGGSGEGSGAVSATRDLKVKNRVNIGQHPMANLVRFKHDASRAIFEKANGFQGYGLFNGEGVRQDVVPSEDVAIDSTIPGEGPKPLVAGISCITCHGVRGVDGWQDVRNDVKKDLDARKAARAGVPALDVFADIARENGITVTDASFIATRYGGDTSKWFTRARDDYASAVLKAAGPWPGAQANQVDVVKVASAYLGSIYHRTYYGRVDASRALTDLGIEVPLVVTDEWAVQRLNQLLPPVAGERVGDVVPESPFLGGLKRGSEIDWLNWQLVYSFAYYRVQKSLAAERKAQEKP